jgi:hypothetical protein
LFFAFLLAFFGVRLVGLVDVVKQLVKFLLVPLFVATLLRFELFAEMLYFSVFSWVHFLLSEPCLHRAWALAFHNHSVVRDEARVRVVFVHARLRVTPVSAWSFEGLVHKLRLSKVAVARIR